MKKIFLLLILSLIQFGIARAQWYSITSPYSGNMLSISFTNSLNGYIGCNTAICRTTDGGATWTSTNSSVFSINGFSWLSPSKGYYGANNNIVGKTIDSGATWSPLNPNASPYAFKTVAFINDTGYAGGTAGTLRKTNDGGANWNPLSASLGTSEVKKIHFFNALTGILCAEGGKIRRTTSGGSSWSTITSGTTSNLYDMFFVNSLIGYIAGASGTILKTVDGGVSWSPLSSGTTQWLYAICFMDALNGYACGANRTMIKTTDGGASWTPEVPPTFASAQFNAITYANNRFFAVNAQGQIVTSAAFVGIVETEEKLNVTVSPIPVTDKVRFSIPDAAGLKGLSLRLYSVSGQEVKRIDNIHSDEIILLRETLPGGVYLYRLSAEHASSTGKIILD